MGTRKKFVQNIIKQRVDRFYNGKPTETKPKVRRIASPYVPGLTERINKILKDYQMNLASKAANTIGNLYTRLKRPIPRNEKSKVIYEIKCECEKRYVGSTKQWVKNRFSKHRSDCKLKKMTETTGLTVHAVREKHEFDFNKFTILDHIPNFFQRNVAEKMHIVRTENNVNLTVDTAGLHQSYVDFFKIHHRPPEKPKTQTTQQAT